MDVVLIVLERDVRSAQPIGVSHSRTSHSIGHTTQIRRSTVNLTRPITSTTSEQQIPFKKPDQWYSKALECSLMLAVFEKLEASLVAMLGDETGHDIVISMGDEGDDDSSVFPYFQWRGR